MVVNGLNIFIIEVYYRCCMVLMGYMKVSGFRYWIFLNGLKKKKIDVLLLVLLMLGKFMYFWWC